MREIYYKTMNVFPKTRDKNDQFYVKLSPVLGVFRVNYNLSVNSVYGHLSVKF